MTDNFIHEICSRCEAAVYDGVRPTLCTALDEYAENVTPEMCVQEHNYHSHAD